MLYSSQGVALGYRSGYYAYGASCSVFIGRCAAYCGCRQCGAVVIGSHAGLRMNRCGSGEKGNVLIGYLAGARGATAPTGTQVGYLCCGCNLVAIGGESFFNAAAANTYITALLADSSNRLKLKSTDGTVYSLAFTTGTSVGYDSGTANTIVVKTTGGTNITDAQFATAVTSWINTDATAKFTASTITSEQSNRTGTAVLITQKTAGRLGNQTAYPKWDVDSRHYSWNDSYIEPFSGGVDGTKKSAGDKVADIYGIMNNSTREFGTDIDSLGDAVGQSLGILVAAIASGGLSLVSGITGESDGDFISGIQIPYNSTISAGGDTYVARNFFMPTGLGKGAFGKSSDANTLPAGVTFDTGDEYTGIQGIMKKIDITHDAGESVYGFNMVFLPADWVA